MDSQFISPISIEKFAAYLDGNLPEAEMQEIGVTISKNDSLVDLVEMSDMIDEDVQTYLQDASAYEADMQMLEESGFEIPQLDVSNNEIVLLSSATDVSDDSHGGIFDAAADSDTIDYDYAPGISYNQHEVSAIDALSQVQEVDLDNDVLLYGENNADVQDLDLFFQNE